jgi:drug/metabolite transporter (DMT)-like permease
MLGMLSVTSMSVSIIIAKQALAEVSAMQATLIRMLSGMAGMLVFGVSTGKIKDWLEPFADIRLAVHFLIAVCVVTFGGFWLSLLAIKHIDVSIANSLGATEPLFVLPLAAIFLKEKITAPALIGAVIIVLGIVLMMY